LKILQIIPYFFLSWSDGAPVELIYELSRSLVHQGHDVTIYTTDVFNKNKLNHKNKNIVNIDGIQVYEFRSISKYPFCISPGMIRALSQTIQTFDVIHLQEYRTFQNIITHHYAKKYCIPYIVQAHGSLPTWMGRKNLNRMYDVIFGFRILKDASRVIALTSTEARQYAMMGIDSNKIEIVPNGIDFSEFEELPKKGAFRKRYSIKRDEKIILYLGRLDKTKGINLLVKAFADLYKDLNNIRLVLIGRDYGAETYLKNLISVSKIDDKVIFTGFVSKNEKMEAFVDSEVFVTPSFYGFPHTFLETMACGTPLITTDKGDELNWIHNKVGYVVKYDKDQLRDAMFKILSDNAMRKRFGEECRMLVKEKFDWPVIVKQFEQVYKNAIDETHDDYTNKTYSMSRGEFG